MPKGPKGEKRPSDVNARAVMIGKIATGEIEDVPSEAPKRAKGGRIGGKQRAPAALSKNRSEIAKKAAQVKFHSA